MQSKRRNNKINKSNARHRHNHLSTHSIIFYLPTSLHVEPQIYYLRSLKLNSPSTQRKAKGHGFTDFPLFTFHFLAKKVLLESP